MIIVRIDLDNINARTDAVDMFQVHPAATGPLGLVRPLPGGP